jgi:hypothetical protein
MFTDLMKGSVSILVEISKIEKQKVNEINFINCIWIAASEQEKTNIFETLHVKWRLFILEEQEIRREWKGKASGEREGGREEERRKNRHYSLS